MNWDNCTGPVDKTGAGPGVYPLVVSVLGIDFLHKAYDVKVIYGNSSQGVPDAWQFDAGATACQGASQLVTTWTWGKSPPANASGCGDKMMQTSTPSLQVPDVNYVTQGYATSLMRLVLANTYPNGVTAINVATRYYLMAFAFDHTFSVDGATTPGSTCGGFIEPMCFKIANASVLDLTGVESWFDRSGGVVQASFNGSSACSAVPAKAKTWGQIKSQYRN